MSPTRPNANQQQLCIVFFINYSCAIIRLSISLSSVVNSITCLLSICLCLLFIIRTAIYIYILLALLTLLFLLSLLLLLVFSTYSPIVVFIIHHVSSINCLVLFNIFSYLRYMISIYYFLILNM